MTVHDRTRLTGQLHHFKFEIWGVVLLLAILGGMTHVACLGVLIFKEDM